ncbi:ABC transporter substrate-binding protein [Acetanaerobacterium elongatum]|uniref:Carbohydrate ABC transporter substrate-binding protein, CUT1 family n=1 Tax=Acetanaerobacterium elongatum TaxID=258515 RepID=A0A1G9WAG0_9FIRM|nr:ABC transporter substrate-binding protein [Acetanaerobacterium elongatum]SDM81206.1 carbohydrate ABC transporter substrate-binding protein, CUT1 family [Acetanaerobacterium elongatum]
MLKAKRILSVALVLCLAVSMVLTGCSTTPAAAPSGSESAAASSAADSAAAPSAASGEDVKLNVWYVGTAQDQGDRVEQALNKYLKETLKSNIQVNLEELGWNPDYTTKVNNALSTGQDVDLVFTSNWAANVQQNAMDGYFVELSNYLAQYPDIEKILGTDFLNSAKIDGKIFALPCNKEHFHSWGMLLRKDLVDKYKVDVTKIKTMKDLEPIYDQILKGEPGITPIAMEGFDVPGYKLLDWDNISDDDVPGAMYPSTDNSKTKIINQLTAPESVAVYKLMKEYLKKGYISPDAASADGVSNLLKTGKYFSAVQSLKPGKDAEMTASTGIEYVQAQMTPDYCTNRENTGAMMAITKQSKHPDEAMKFLSLLYTDANVLNYIIYGEKDKDYTVNADGTITLVSGSGYASGNGWRMGNQLTTLRLSFEAADKYEQWDKLNKSAPSLYSVGFMFNKSNNDIQTQVANCKAVTQEYFRTLLSGQSKDVDKDVAAMDAKFKTAGVDKLLAEMQKQFDEWAKAKK